MAPQDKHQD